MACLSLQLFRGFALSASDGTAIPLRLKKERALLAYLALHPDRKFTRGHLAGLLWSEQTEAKARHSLSQTLSAVNRSLRRATREIHRGHDEIFLTRGSVDTDVVAFQSLARSDAPDQLRKAVESYHDDLLVDVELFEPGFDDWAYSLRAQCHELVMRAGLDYLSCSVDHDIIDRTSIARRLLHFDSTAEAVHQALIRVLLESGQLGAAMKQFESCRTTLEQELGVDPSPETHRLVQQVHETTTRGTSAIAQSRAEASLEDVPSLVVVPIENLSGDPELEYLTQGITEDITTELARYHSLFVISYESSALANPPGETSVLCRRFGVRHAMRGSIRSHGAGYRVNLRLVDGDSGRNVWGERYDLGAEELLALPSMVVEQTIGRLATWLEQQTLIKARHKPTESWNAYEHILQGLSYHHRNWYGIYNTLRAIKHFERAIEIDPDCARAYAYLACAKAYPYFKDRRHDRLGTCTELAHRAIELDPTEAEAHRVLGGIHLSAGEHEISCHHFEQARRIHPGHSYILAHAARYHMHTGEPGEATRLMGRAQQLNPLHLPWYWEHFGIAAFVAGDYQAAIKAFGRMQNRSFYDQLYVAAANAHLNRMRHAKRSLAFALQKKPGLHQCNVSYLFPYRNRNDLGRVVSGLEKAGLRHG